MSATLMNRSFDGQNLGRSSQSKVRENDEKPFFYQRWRGARVEK
jgi:hypothetical protein